MKKKKQILSSILVLLFLNTSFIFSQNYGYSTNYSYIFKEPIDPISQIITEQNDLNASTTYIQGLWLVMGGANEPINQVISNMNSYLHELNNSNIEGVVQIMNIYQYLKNFEKSYLDDNIMDRLEAFISGVNHNENIKGWVIDDDSTPITSYTNETTGTTTEMNTLSELQKIYSLIKQYSNEDVYVILHPHIFDDPNIHASDWNSCADAFICYTYPNMNNASYKKLNFEPDSWREYNSKVVKYINGIPENKSIYWGIQGFGRDTTTYSLRFSRFPTQKEHLYQTLYPFLITNNITGVFLWDYHKMKSSISDNPYWHQTIGIQTSELFNYLKPALANEIQNTDIILSSKSKIRKKLFFNPINSTYVLILASYEDINGVEIDLNIKLNFQNQCIKKVTSLNNGEEIQSFCHEFNDEILSMDINIYEIETSSSTENILAINEFNTNFSDANGYNSGQRFFKMDINGDNMDDIIVRDGSGTFHIRISIGNTFQIKPIFNSGFSDEAGYNSGQRFFIMDINGDNMDDLLIRDANGTFHIRQSIGNTFQIKPSFSTGLTDDAGYNSGQRFFIMDINGDNIDDLIIRDSEGTFHIRQFDGTSLVEKTTFESGFSDANGYNLGQRFFIMDINGDHKDDIIIRDGSGTFHIRQSIGNTFQIKPSFSSGFSDAAGYNSGQRFFILDLNGDHMDDIIVRDGSGTFHIRQSIGNTFQIKPSFSSGFSDAAGYNSGQRFFILDLNGDHMDDIVVRDGSGNFHIRQSVGNTFEINSTYATDFTDANGYNDGIRYFIMDVNGDCSEEIFIRNPDGTFHIFGNISELLEYMISLNEN